MVKNEVFINLSTTSIKDLEVVWHIAVFSMLGICWISFLFAGFSVPTILIFSKHYKDYVCLRFSIIRPFEPLLKSLRLFSYY